MFSNPTQVSRGWVGPTIKAASMWYNATSGANQYFLYDDATNVAQVDTMLQVSVETADSSNRAKYPDLAAPELKAKAHALVLSQRDVKRRHCHEPQRQTCVSPKHFFLAHFDSALSLLINQMPCVSNFSFFESFAQFYVPSTQFPHFSSTIYEKGVLMSLLLKRALISGSHVILQGKGSLI